MYDSLPADRREIARAAFSATFGSASVTALQPVRGGATAAVIYRVDVAGRPYLLRLEPPHDNKADRRRAYVCLQAAAEAGVAPPLHHADPVAGVAIMDFIVAHPLADYPGGPARRAHDLGQLLARLQATPAFPPRTANHLVVLAGWLDRLLTSGRFAAGLIDRHREGFERIRAAYVWDEEKLVSSHNDLHPDNILFDGKRPWLIDWDTACRNDPLVDVAIVANYQAASPEREDVLVRAWLGHAPNRLLRARLLLMRQLGRLFYACASSLTGTTRPAVPDGDLTALTPAEFLAAVAAGRIVLGTPEAQRLGGKVALRTFLEGLATPQFEEALVISRAG
jgi:aminoglycoside phosphotransferase (APT) family kinase protein